MSGDKRIAVFLIAAFLLLGVPVHASGEASAGQENVSLYPNGLVIKDAADFAAPEGKIVCMTVDGVLQDVKPGNYTGHEVVIWTLDEQTADIAGAGALAVPQLALIGQHTLAVIKLSLALQLV